MSVDLDDVSGLVYLATIWLGRASIMNLQELKHLEYRLRTMARHYDSEDSAVLVLFASAVRVYIDNYDTI